MVAAEVGGARSIVNQHPERNQKLLFESYHCNRQAKLNDEYDQLPIVPLRSISLSLSLFRRWCNEDRCARPFTTNDGSSSFQKASTVPVRQAKYIYICLFMADNCTIRTKFTCIRYLIHWYYCPQKQNIFLKIFTTIRQIRDSQKVRPTQYTTTKTIPTIISYK